jgi:branched-chain amino acid transport system ATP-binding protein
MSLSTEPAGAATTADESPVLAGEDITVRFGGLKALADFSIVVPRKTIVGLIGPNGAGKSTAVGVLSGLVSPLAGKVSLGGEDVTHLSPEGRARRGLARTFQHVELFAGLSVREHLILPWRMRFARQRRWRDLLDGRAWRKPPSEEVDRIDGLLRLLGIERIAQAPIASLPLGTCRLVEVARALAASPSVVLLDEPLAGLDPRESQRLAHALRQAIDSEGVSFLFIDHDVDTVLAHSSHIVVLDFGETIAAGTPETVRADEKVRRAYLGDTFVSVPEETT